jgi:hypothetical protein
MSFEQQVQQWVQLDNQIKTLNDKLKTLRENRQSLTESLTKQAERNNTKHSPIQISDGKLKFASVNVSNPLTFKYVEKCLGEIIQSRDQVEKIMNYLKKNREIKLVNDIRRFTT